MGVSSERDHTSALPPAALPDNSAAARMVSFAERCAWAGGGAAREIP